MQIELDHHPESQPQPAGAIPGVQNPYQVPKAALTDHVSTPMGALWNPNAAANWSLVFSPAFGSFLHYRNWQTLGDEEEAREAKIWFVVSLVILAILPFIPHMVEDPNVKEFAPRGICFWFLIIWYFAAARSQARLVKEHFDGDYKRRSWGLPMLIALGSLLAYFAYCIMIAGIFLVASH